MHVKINFSLAKCYRNIGRIEQANKELDKGIDKVKSQKAEASKGLTS